MATPRKASVAISVANAPQVDLTDDLISFTFEESVSMVGEVLTIELDDASKRYRSIWFLPKGTPIQATITTTDWNFPGDKAERITGTCWIDTIELDVKPPTVTIKATSVSPNLC